MWTCEDLRIGWMREGEDGGTSYKGPMETGTGRARIRKTCLVRQVSLVTLMTIRALRGIPVTHRHVCLGGSCDCLSHPMRLAVAIRPNCDNQ